MGVAAWAAAGSIDEDDDEDESSVSFVAVVSFVSTVGVEGIAVTGAVTGSFSGLSATAAPNANDGMAENNKHPKTTAVTLNGQLLRLDVILTPLK